MGACGGGEDLGNLVQWSIEQRVPLFVHWDLTWRCDHRCVHCYLTERRQPELDLEECIGVLDQLVEAGTLFLLLSGGDLFLRRDALDILRAARARQFDVKLITHGNHVDETVADALAEMGISKVALSLYAQHAPEHDAVTLVPGSHVKTLAAVRRLRARGLRVQLKTPLMRHNRRGWAGIGELAESLGADWEIDPHLLPDDTDDFGLCEIGADSQDRILAAMRGMDARRAELRPVPDLGDASSDTIACSAATASAYITPDGRLQSCINWRETLGDLRRASFAELWSDDNPVLARQREIRRGSYLADCHGCSLHGKCAYCPGISLAETGDPGRRSAYVCDRTHLTMAAIEYLVKLEAAGEPTPDPGDRAAVEALFTTHGPTAAERALAARRGRGESRDRARPAGPVIQIRDPRP